MTRQPQIRHLAMHNYEAARPIVTEHSTGDSVSLHEADYDHGVGYAVRFRLEHVPALERAAEALRRLEGLSAGLHRYYLLEDDGDGGWEWSVHSLTRGELFGRIKRNQAQGFVTRAFVDPLRVEHALQKYDRARYFVREVEQEATAERRLCELPDHFCQALERERDQDGASIRDREITLGDTQPAAGKSEAKNG